MSSHLIGLRPGDYLVGLWHLRRPCPCACELSEREAGFAVVRRAKATVIFVATDDRPEMHVVVLENGLSDEELLERGNSIAAEMLKGSGRAITFDVRSADPDVIEKRLAGWPFHRVKP